MSNHEQPLVACVVLSCNRREDTLACLRSIEAGTYRHICILLLDALSTDGTADAVRAAHPAVTVADLVENRGYAGNNNVGLTRALAAGADWIFLLNDDVVLAPDCLERLLEAVGEQQHVGVAGPVVYHADEPDVIQSAGGELTRTWQARHLGQNEHDRGQFAAPRAVEWLTGCALLVRREAVIAAGRLDDRFFMYWEEVEWCHRIRAGGWQVLAVPSAKAWHRGVRREYQPSPEVTYYSTRNRLLMLSTGRAPVAAWIVAGLQLLRTLVSWSLRPRWQHQRAHRAAMLRGIADFLRGRLGRDRAAPSSAAAQSAARPT